MASVPDGTDRPPTDLGPPMNWSATTTAAAPRREVYADSGWPGARSHLQSRSPCSAKVPEMDTRAASRRADPCEEMIVSPGEEAPTSPRIGEGRRRWSLKMPSDVRTATGLRQGCCRA